MNCCSVHQSQNVHHRVSHGFARMLWGESPEDITNWFTIDQQCNHRASPRCTHRVAHLTHIKKLAKWKKLANCITRCQNCKWKLNKQIEDFSGCVCYHRDLTECRLGRGMFVWYLLSSGILSTELWVTVCVCECHQVCGCARRICTLHRERQTCHRGVPPGLRAYPEDSRSWIQNARSIYTLYSMLTMCLESRVDRFNDTTTRASCYCWPSDFCSDSGSEFFVSEVGSCVFCSVLGPRALAHAIWGTMCRHRTESVWIQVHRRLQIRTEHALDSVHRHCRRVTQLTVTQDITVTNLTNNDKHWQRKGIAKLKQIVWYVWY